MKNLIDVLRSKEQELLRVRKEIEALRIAARLLEEEHEAHAEKEDLRQLVQMP